MNKRKILTLAMALCMVAILAIGGTLAYFTDTDYVNNTFSMGKVDIVLDEYKVDEDGKKIKTVDRVHENDYTPTNMVPGYEFDKDPTIHVMQGSEDSYIFLDVTLNKYSSLFWVMAADAAADEKINLPLYNDEGNLAAEFKSDERPVFSTTKFIAYMKANPDTMRKIMDKWFIGITHSDWAVMDVYAGVDKEDVSKEGKYMTLRLAYQGDDDGTPNTVNAKEIKVESIDIKFMDQFKMPASVTQEMIAAGQTVGGMENTFNTTKEGFHLNFKAYAIQAATLNDVDAAHKALFGVDAQF